VGGFDQGGADPAHGVKDEVAGLGVGSDRLAGGGGQHLGWVGGRSRQVAAAPLAGGGCWAVGHTDSGNDPGACRSATGRHLGGAGEDEYVLVDDEMGGLVAGSGPASLGELPKRRSGDQPSVSDRGMQGDEMLEVDESGVVGQLDGQGGQVIELTGSAGVLGHRDQQPTRAQQLAAAGQHPADPLPPTCPSGLAEVGWVAGVVQGVLWTELLAGQPGWFVNHPGLARIGGGGDQQVHLSSDIGQQLGQVAGVTNSNLGQGGPIGREGVVEVGPG
jgi:hypothetical protein